MGKNKVSVSSCCGMSPYGLVSRVACADTVDESENAVSLCITATSADRAGFTDIIKKYPIIAVNGCENRCVDKILEDKGVKVARTINVLELLNEKGLRPSDIARIDEESEDCVQIIKNKIKYVMDELS